jgi:outer membrane protein assembly factor BamB
MVACSCCVTAGLRAQEVDPPGQPEGLHADATYADVYVDDSFEAADAITRAQRLVDRGRWSEAAELLQRTADAAGGKLVRVGPGRYAGIREHINRTIAGWPGEGIAAYRNLFEDKLRAGVTAPSRLRSSRDLLLLFERYFCTSSAAVLADTIGQLALESGDLTLADYVYRRVLKQHPDRSTHATRFQAMLTLLAVMRGEPAGEVSESRGEVKIRWMGRDRTLREVVDAINGDFSVLRGQVSTSTWPIFGGNTERNRSSATDVDELGLLWRVGAFDREDVGSPGSGIEVTVGGARVDSRDFSVHPIVSGGLIVAQRGREIVALHQNTGALAWRFRADGTDIGELSYLDEQPPGWDSPTIYGGRLYASLPGDVVPYYSYESAHSPPELICLDLETGGVIWRVDQDLIEEAFAEVTFDSSPIVRHESVYVVGRRRRSFGFEDCYLYRFNARNGNVEQRVHLGSASTGAFGPQTATRTITCLHGDVVYVCTNLGTVAAVSAHTDAVRWLRLYHRARADTGEGLTRYARDAKPWQFNPVIWSAGRLVVFPTDAASVLILAATDGTVQWSIPVDQLGDAESVLGVQGDLLYTAGREVTCYDIAAGSRRWSTPLPEEASPYGRGVWAGDRLLVPTKAHLCAFGVADGERTDITWDTEGEGGNLLVTPEQLLVAGGTHISAYVRRAEIWSKLRERMAAAPADPLPALELAEIALNNGEYAEAVSVLDEAVRRVEQLREPLRQGLVRRLFDDVMMFVDRLSTHANLKGELLEKLFSYASRYPPDAVAQLRYRFTFAAWFETLDEPARAIGLYQQILRDRSLRELAVDFAGARVLSRPPDGGGVVRGFAIRRGSVATSTEVAGRRAQTRIADLIVRHGRSVYAVFDTEAGRWLASGRAAGDMPTLQRVVDTFPNSDAAPLALIAQGELLVERGKSLEAADRFARAYHWYPGEVDRPLLLRRIADAYEAGGKVEHAYRWLTKAAREHPSVRIDHGGRAVTFLEYRERLAQVRDRVEPSRPSIVLPLDNRFEHEFEGSVALLSPWFGSEPASDWSRFYVRTPEGIRAYDARTGAEAWLDPATVRADADLLIATSDTAVFSTLYEVFGLDVETGKRRWSHGDYPEHLDHPLGDWEDGEAFRAHTLYGRRLVSVRDNGKMTCIAIDTGDKLWAEVHRPKPAGRLRLTDSHVVYHVTQDDDVMVCLIDASTGRWSDAINTEEQQSVEDLFVTLDERLVVVTSRSVSSYAPQARVRRWRVSFDGHLRRASLLMDIDALYYSQDGRRIRKISLEDGRLLWESQRLAGRGDDDLTVERHGASVIVSTDSAVSAVDAVTGLTLWEGATPERPRFLARRLTDSYVMAVDVPGGLLEKESIAYFYDHRNASGMIARNGGALKLDGLDDVRAILAADHALLIQTGSTVRGWSHP